VTSIISLPLAYFFDTIPVSGARYVTYCHPDSDDYATLRRRDRHETVFRVIR
jgi:hypothetical protein